MMPLSLALLLAAPVPPAPAVAGKYALVQTSSSLPTGRGGFNPQPGPSAATTRREVTVTHDRIAIEGRAAIEYQIDTSAKPMTVDLAVTSLRGKVTRHKGIVDVSGERLLLAYGAANGERPKDFEDADGVTVYVFQKAPPPPHWEYRIVALRAGVEAEAEQVLNKLAAEGYEIAQTVSGPSGSHLILKRQKP